MKQTPDAYQDIRDAVRGELSFTNEAGKRYALNDKTATLLLRPRGWHLDEKHVHVDGARVSAGIFDFALSFFHNARAQLERGAGPFSAAVCVSPMTGLHRGRAIRALSMLLALGGTRQTNYMPSTGPYDRAQRPFARNDVTSDERRYRFTDDWFTTDPRLALGGPTVGWVKQAFRAMDRLMAPGMLERIGLPLMVVSATADRVVDASSHNTVVARVQGAQHVVMNGAEHEILMEADTYRAQFWHAFDQLARTLG